jgi:aspartate dehydrogenase
MKSVGIIGCGAIGSLIAASVDKGIVNCDKLILFDHDFAKAKALCETLKTEGVVVSNVGEMLEMSPNVIVEAASQDAVREYVCAILKAKAELIVMSVGALLDMNIKSSKIHTPSGAIGGLDAIANAALAGIDKAVLTTKKNPNTLDLSDNHEKLIFEGNAYEAVKRFPKEMNVAATLAMATQPEKLLVRLVSDPRTERNTHEIAVKWRNGDMVFKFSNDPHPENPKTSALAAWSAIKLLKDILEKQP